MPRPARHNADYFPHQADFRNDRRIKAIRARFGAAGYGLVLMLLETLCNADHIQLSTDELELELVAGDLGVSVTEIDSLLQVAEKIQLFARNETGFLICPDLNKALEPVFDKRNRARNAVQSPPDVVSVTETPESVTETTQRKVKESKEEERKEKVIAIEQARKDGAAAPVPPATTDLVINVAAPAIKSRYGDGELHQQCLAYNQANPGRYTPKLYEEFLIHWTARVQTGKKTDVGKELWRTRETFALAVRLSTWKQKDDTYTLNSPASVPRNPVSATVDAGKAGRTDATGINEFGNWRGGNRFAAPRRAGVGHTADDAA